MASGDLLSIAPAGTDLFRVLSTGGIVSAGATSFTGAVTYGVNDTGVDVTFYGATSGSYMLWDESADALKLTDSTPILMGDAAAGDVSIQFDGTNLKIHPIVADTGALALGANDAGMDLILYGDTASVNATWDQSADSLIFTDAAKLVLGTSSDDSIQHNGTNTIWTHGTGNLDFDNTAATGATYVTLGADDGNVEFAVRNNSEARAFIVTGAGNLSLGAAASDTIDHVGQILRSTSGTGTGQVVEQEGTSATEGWQRVVFENTISPAAVETAVVTVPAGSVVEGVWANVETALTGGGTTVTWSLGISGGDLDGFGTATSDGYTTAGDALTQNSKWTYIAGATPLGNAGALIGLFSASAQAIVLTGTATGGTAAGDTALTVGSIRIRVQYRTALKMDNAA